MINVTILLPYLSNYWRREVWCGNVKYLLFHLVAESNQLYVRTPQTTSIEKITIQFQKKIAKLRLFLQSARKKNCQYTWLRQKTPTLLLILHGVKESD